MTYKHSMNWIDLQHKIGKYGYAVHVYRIKGKLIIEIPFSDGIEELIYKEVIEK